jgi:hypothetical protein
MNRMKKDNGENQSSNFLVLKKMPYGFYPLASLVSLLNSICFRYFEYAE